MLDERRGRLTRDGIRIHEAADFAGMRAAGRAAAGILDALGPHVFPGQTTGEIDRIITAMVPSAGAVVGHDRLQGLPARVLHLGEPRRLPRHPGDKVLKDGDVLNIDVTVIVDGWYGDSSRMYVAGTPSRKAERLIQVTHDALMRGIEAARPGHDLRRHRRAIQAFVEGNRMSVVRDFCGHGWAACSTRRPNVLHYGRPGRGRGSRRGCSSPSSPW
jgi:methionyl aminopeptidase